MRDCGAGPNYNVFGGMYIMFGKSGFACNTEAAVRHAEAAVAAVRKALGWP